MNQKLNPTWSAVKILVTNLATASQQWKDVYSWCQYWREAAGSALEKRIFDRLTSDEPGGPEAVWGAANSHQTKPS